MKYGTGTTVRSDEERGLLVAPQPPVEGGREAGREPRRSRQALGLLALGAAILGSAIFWHAVRPQGTNIGTEADGNIGTVAVPGLDTDTLKAPVNGGGAPAPVPHVNEGSFCDPDSSHCWPRTWILGGQKCGQPGTNEGTNSTRRPSRK